METTSIINEEALRQELVDFFGLGSLETEEQNKIVERLLESLMKSIFAETFERLGESGLEEYERLLERASTEGEVAAFLEKKIPGYTVFVREIVSDFKHSLEERMKVDEV